MNVVRILISLPFLALIKLYQLFVSPLFPASCRFYPSCSTYSYQAIAKYGPFKGGRLAAKRILKCHPRNPGGFDPIP